MQQQTEQAPRGPNATTPQLFHEIAEGGGLSLAQAAKLFPGRRGLGIAPSSVHRWAGGGVRAHDGKVVRLEAAAVGNRKITTRQAVARFLVALNGGSEHAAAAVGPPTAPPAPRARGAPPMPADQADQNGDGPRTPGPSPDELAEAWLRRLLDEGERYSEDRPGTRRAEPAHAAR